LKKLQRLFLLIFTLLCIFTLTACSGDSNERYTNSINIGVMRVMDSFPIFLAEELGFFADEGLDVTIEVFSNATERDTFFQVSSSMDGMLFDLVSFSNFINAGVDIVAVSDIHGFASIIGAPGIYTLNDLVGNNVLMAFNSAMHYILYTTLVRGGINPENVTMQAIPSLPTRMEMLLNNQAAAATLPEPFVTMALNNNLNVIATTHELNINPFLIGFRREVTIEKEQELRAFYRALNRAVDHINASSREDLIDLFIDLSNFPEPLRATMEIPQFNRFNTISATNIESVFTFARQHGLLEIDVNVQDLIFNAID